MNIQQTPKIDLYQEVTDRIVQCLEEGVVPWLKPWHAPKYSTINFGLPQNAVSGRPYGGVNILLLWMATAQKGFSQRKWITALAANKLGGHIRKGEKATIVVNYTPVDREKLDEEGNPIMDEDGFPEMERFAVLKRHPLFNISQCEKLPQEWYEAVKPQEERIDENQYELFEEIRLMQKGMDIEVQVKPSNRAYYHNQFDHIVMPEMKQFSTPQKFYSVLLHEMTHATGHQKRLAREGIVSGKAIFGNKVYAFEELVAEMGCAFLCAYLGFSDVPQNAAYIESWIKVLKNDKRAIFRASGKAREACQYMLDILEAEYLEQRYSEFSA